MLVSFFCYLVQNLQKAVDSRYKADSRAIDLSEFFLDPVFTANNAHMLLSKNNVMLAVLDRIDEKFGSITALSLKVGYFFFMPYSSQNSLSPTEIKPLAVSLKL